jgi:hypothetical protein
MKLAKMAPEEKRDRSVNLRLNEKEDSALTLVARDLHMTDQDALRHLIATAAANLRKRPS